MIIHAMNNAVSGEFVSPMFTGADSVQLAWMRTLAWGVAALIVLAAQWKWWTSVEDDRAPAREPLPESP